LGTVEGAFLHFIQTVYQSIGWPGVIALMTIESAFIPIPSEIIMPFAGWFLVKSQGLGLGWVFFLAFFGALGNLLGALFLYWIGWIGARPVVERWGKYALITRNDLTLRSVGSTDTARSPCCCRGCSPWLGRFSAFPPEWRTCIRSSSRCSRSSARIPSHSVSPTADTYWENTGTK